MSWAIHNTNSLTDLMRRSYQGSLFYRHASVHWLVNWCFEPSQPLGIIFWPKETFIKRYIVERTNKAEIRPEEQIQRVDGRIYGMKYS